MSNTVIIKRSSTPNAVPTTGQITYGELAINYLDGNLFYKNASDQIVTIASNQFVSVTGNVTGGNINTSGQISATGNVTGNYIIGDGSLLSNVNASAGSTILNGNSNVAITTSNGNVTVAVNGVDTAQFGQASFFVQGPIATPKSVTTQAIMANNVNGIMISPVTIQPTGNIFIPDGSTLTIFTPT